MPQFNLTQIYSRIKQVLKFSLPLKIWLVAIIILIIPLILYSLPYPVSFNGEIYTYDLRWNSPLDKKNLIIENLEVLALNIKGKNIEIDGNHIQQELNFGESNQSYSVQDLEITGTNKLRIIVNDGKKKPDFLLIKIEADDKKKAAQKIYFRVLNNVSKLSPWQYQQGHQKVQVQGQNYISISATSIELIAYLIDNHRNDLFSIYNLPISPDSMRFENIKEQSNQPRTQSTTLGGTLSLLKHPEDIQLTEKGQYIKFGSPGIEILNELSLYRCQNQEQNQTLCVLAKVAGKTQRIEIGQDFERPSKTYKFNMLIASIGSEYAKWLVGGIIAAFIGFLFYILQESLKIEKN